MSLVTFAHSVLALFNSIAAIWPFVSVPAVLKTAGTSGIRDGLAEEEGG
jgi:hypothetical protein